MSPLLDPDLLDERAAIIEYDGGFPREEAEALAACWQAWAPPPALSPASPLCYTRPRAPAPPGPEEPPRSTLTTVP